MNITAKIRYTNSNGIYLAANERNGKYIARIKFNAASEYMPNPKNSAKELLKQIKQESYYPDFKTLKRAKMESSSRISSHREYTSYWLVSISADVEITEEQYQAVLDAQKAHDVLREEYSEKYDQYAALHREITDLRLKMDSGTMI